MIAVEGPDGGGKTTLARELAREFGLQIFDRGPRDALMKDVRGSTYRVLGMAVMGATPVTVLDRFFLSELVYGDIIREHVEFTDVEQDYIFRILRGLQCPIILCMPPFEKVHEHVFGSEQMAGVPPAIGSICAMYQDLYFAWEEELDLIWYDYTDDNPRARSDITYRVGRYMRERKERSW